MEKHLKKNYQNTRFFLIFILLIFFCLPNQKLLLADEDSSKDKLNREFLTNFSHDFLKTFTSPKNWDDKDILALSGIIGGGILLYSLDKDIHDWFQGNRTSSSDDLFKLIQRAGNGGFLLGLMTALYVSGEITDNNSLRKTALLSLESWVTSGVLVLGLKFLTGRARPKTGSKDDFHPFSFKGYLSFPAGHSCSAFAVATSIADQSRETSIDILAYSLATLVTVSRVHNNKHWASDVFIGSALGYLIAKKISSLDRNRHSAKIRVDVQVSPQKQALSLNLSF